jgi:hypothetical protein
MANAAVLLASAVILGLVALHADHRSNRHGCLQRKLYLSTAQRGKRRAALCRETLNHPKIVNWTVWRFFDASLNAC